MHLDAHLFQPSISEFERRLENPAAKLVTDIDYATKMHNMYSAALLMYAFPVQATINDIKASDVQCVCTNRIEQCMACTTNTRNELPMEATGLLSRIENMSIAFKKVEIGMLSKWEKTGMTGLQRMVDALPGTKHLKEKTVAKKYFQGRSRRCRV